MAAWVGPQRKEAFPFNYDANLYTQDEFKGLQEFYFILIDKSKDWKLQKTDDEFTVQYLETGKHDTPVGRCSVIININNFSPRYVLEYFGQHINISTEWFTYYHNSYGNKQSSIYKGYSNTLLYQRNRYNRLQHAKFQTKSAVTDHRDYIIQEIGICNKDYCLLSQRSLTNKSSDLYKYHVAESKSYVRGTNYRCGIAFHKLTQNKCKITVIGEYIVGNGMLDWYIGSGHRINHCYKLCKSLAKLAPLILPPVIFYGNGNGNGNYNYENDKKENSNGNNYNDRKEETDENLYDYVRKYDKKFNTNTNAVQLNVAVGKIATQLSNLVADAALIKDEKLVNKAISLVQCICQSIQSFVLTLGWNQECENEIHREQFYERDNQCIFYVFIESTQNITKRNIGMGINNANVNNNINVRFDVKLFVILTSKEKGIKKLNRLINGTAADAIEYIRQQTRWAGF